MHASYLCIFSPLSQTLAALPDQDSFYDVTDCLEHQGIEHLMQKHINSKVIDPDLKQQFTIYEVQEKDTNRMFNTSSAVHVSYI